MKHKLQLFQWEPKERAEIPSAPSCPVVFGDCLEVKEKQILVAFVFYFFLKAKYLSAFGLLFFNFLMIYC